MDFTLSPKHNSKKDVKQWIQYAKCMINGYSIRKCAEEVKISIPTSLYWRHKILDAIRAFMGIGSVGGVIEVDEAFFRESFKGDHKKSTTFTMPRKAHKRGVKGSYSSKDEKKKRGISKEQVCVLCAIDRTGNLITELICKGRMKHTDLERLFTGRIEDEAILCTDSHKSYINSFHIKLKKWMDRFNGVATKYLANYMYWFKWLEIFNTEKDTIKSKNLLVQSHTSHIDTKLKDFRIREAIYI